MLESLILLAAGFLLLVWGADRLVAGASAFARNLGVSPLIIGLTIVGFGTSAPEMVVSVIAAVKGSPAIAVGNAIGSNIANVGLILGLTAIIYPLRVQSDILKREYPLLMIIMLGATWLMRDYSLSRSDGIILLIGLFALLSGMVFMGLKRNETDALAQEFEAEIPTDMSTRMAIFWLALGMIILPTSSALIVEGATNMARLMGVSDAVIAVTIVALGTSLPELAAAITSAVKHEDDIAIGNVIGSNMFNLLGVLGIAAVITHTPVSPMLLHRDALVMFILTLLLFVFAWGIKSEGRIKRHEGVLLLSIYLGFMGWAFYTELG